MGQRLAALLDRLEAKITTERTSKIRLSPQDISSLNKSFQSGLKLCFLDKKKKYSWSSSSIDKSKSSQLAYVIGDLPVNLREKFKNIQIFMWKPLDIMGPPFRSEMISLLNRLPPVSTLIVGIGISHFEVNFYLKYEKTSAVTQLCRFIFKFDRRFIPFLKEFP